jgi:hypothetical protein
MVGGRAGGIDWLVSVDSTVVRAASAGGRNPSKQTAMIRSLGE